MQGGIRRSEPRSFTAMVGVGGCGGFGQTDLGTYGAVPTPKKGDVIFRRIGGFFFYAMRFVLACDICMTDVILVSSCGVWWWHRPVASTSIEIPSYTASLPTRRQESGDDLLGALKTWGRPSSTRC